MPRPVTFVGTVPATHQIARPRKHIAATASATESHSVTAGMSCANSSAEPNREDFTGLSVISGSELLNDPIEPRSGESNRVQALRIDFVLVDVARVEISSGAVPQCRHRI